MWAENAKKSWTIGVMWYNGYRLANLPALTAVLTYVIAGDCVAGKERKFSQ